MAKSEEILRQNLENVSFDRYFLQIKEVKQLSKSGWNGFSVFLKNQENLLSQNPVVRGIYSVGGKDVQPWIDMEYWQEHRFFHRNMIKEKLDLENENRAVRLFQTLGNLIPPGGHMMVSYEGEQDIHKETILGLEGNIPPAATPLGYLIFQSGFHYIKNWYLSEGGFEGPRKLWGEKAPDNEWEKNFLERTSREIKGFLNKKPSSSYPQLEKKARNWAQKINEIIFLYLSKNNS
ncbi:DUF1122 family protein [bacterium]|nr:DUF1122 family protein [bacterium]